MKNNTKNTPKKRNRHTREQDGTSLSEIIKSSTIGWAISLAIFTLLIFIATIVCYSAEDPIKLIPTLSAIILIITSFIGGIVSAKINKTKFLICGIFNGILINLFSLLVGLFASDNTESFPLLISFIIRIALLLFSCIGAIICANHPKAHQRSKR